MIEFRMLGALELRGRNGRELRAVLRQPKRLALLAYLAATHRQGFQRRDTLLGLFWPELDASHARNALRQALHHLRRHLGHDTLIARGEDEVGLAEGSLSCDVVAFERALAREDGAAALEHYRGDLLPGFHLSGAPEFGRWLDQERVRLRDCAARAASGLAEREGASGNLGLAAHWAHRALELSPYDECSLRRLVELLDRNGDRAAAIRAYERFAERLADELDLAPSAETDALVARIRTAERHDEDDERGAASASEPAGDEEGDDRRTEATPAPAGNPVRRLLQRPRHIATGLVALVVLGVLGSWALLRSPAAHTPSGRTRIAVFPFSVRGDPDFDYLGEGMVDLLSTTLDGAAGFRAVEPYAVLRKTERRGGQGTGLEEARAIAAELGAGRFVLGNVVETAGRLRMSVRLYTVDDAGVETVRASVEGDPSQLFALVDELAAQLLAGSETGTDPSLTRVAARTTESLPALKAYLEGEREFRAGRGRAAVAALRRATAADSLFALAYYRMATAALWAERIAVAHEALARARRLGDRLPEPDRAVIEGWNALLAGEHARAERLFRETASAYPDHSDAWFGLGKTLFLRGVFLGRSFAEAGDALRRAGGLSQHVPGLMTYFATAVRHGDPAELDSLSELMLRLDASDPRTPEARLMRALPGILRGDTVELARTMSEMEVLSDAAAQRTGGWLTFATANLDAGRRLWRILADPKRSPGYRAMAYMTLAKIEVVSGRWRAALRELERLEEIDYAAGIEHRALFALTRFLPVPRAELVAYRDELLSWDAEPAEPGGDGLLGEHAAVHPYLRLYLLGLLSARLGDYDEAADIAAELDRRASGFAVPGYVRDLSRSVRMEMAWSRGRLREALAILEGARFWEKIVLPAGDSPFFSHAYERLARPELLNELGREEEALRWYMPLADRLFYEGAYCHLRIAEIYDRMGKSEQAARHYARFVRFWHYTDPELRPLVDRARQRLTRLDPESSR